jgi:hypothetical protein
VTPLVAFIVGAVLAIGFVALARRFPPARERRIYAVGLVFAALVYVGFGLTGEASAQWLGFEVLGVVLYGAAAWLGVRGQTWLLAFGWAAHVAWDAIFHLSGAGAEYTPDWYPWLCLSFDLLVAVAVVASSRRVVAA